MFTVSLRYTTINMRYLMMIGKYNMAKSTKDRMIHSFRAIILIGLFVFALNLTGQAEAAVINTTEFTGNDSAQFSGQIEGYWTFSTNSGRSWEYDRNTTTSGSVGPNCPYDGIAYAYTEASSGSNGDEWYAVSPVLDLDTYDYTIDFNWDKHHNNAATCGLYVELSTDGGSTYPTTLFSTTQDDGTGSSSGSCNIPVDWHNQVVDLSSYSGNNAKVRFRTTSPGAFQCDTAIDKIITDRAAACTPSTGPLSITDITSKGGSPIDLCADVTTNGASNLQYEISEGVSGGITYLSSSSVVNTTGNTLTVSKPAGTMLEDVMLAVITSRDSNTYPSIPAGWTIVPGTQIEDATGGPDTRSTIAWKRAGGSEPVSYSFTNDGDMIGAISTFRGVITSGSPIDASNAVTNGSGTTVNAPSITTTVVNTMVLFTSHVGDNWSHNDGSWSATNPVSFTETFDGNTTTGDDRAVAMAYALKATTGATGGGTVTISTSDDAKVGALIALKPATAIVRHGPNGTCDGISTSGWTDGATHALTVTGDDDCNSALTPAIDNFLWNSCANASTLSLSVSDNITGPLAISGTGSATDIEVRWREDSDDWSGWSSNGSTFTPTTCTTGTVDFEARGTDSNCGAYAITASDYSGAFDTLDPDTSTISIPASQTAYSDPYDAEQLLVTTGDVGSFEYRVTTSGLPTQLNWGDTTNNGTNTNVNWTRTMGGMSPNEDNMVLKSVSVYVNGTHTSQVRIGVYEGGDLAVGPDNATLLCDAGTTLAGGTNQYLTRPCADTAITKNTPLWIAVKGNDGNFGVQYQTGWDSSSGFQSARGRFQSASVSTNEGTSYPNPWPANDNGSFSNFWYSFYLTYESGSGETICTNWSSGSLPASISGGSGCGDYVETAGNYNLYARGADPDCGDPVTSVPASRTFTWNSCTDTNFSDVSIDNPLDGSFVSGTVSIGATRTFADAPVGTNDVQYRINTGSWTNDTVGWDTTATHPESVTVPVYDVTVQVRALEDECGYFVYDTYTVSIDNRVCSRQDPTIEFIPSSGNVPSGGTRSYTVRIKNNDTPTCGDSISFDYSLGTETGDTGSFDPTYFNNGSQSLASSMYFDVPAGLTHNATLDSVEGETLTSPINIAAVAPRSAVSASVTSTVANYMVHNSDRFPANLYNQYWGGDWGVTASSKYGKFQCSTCHARDDAGNIKRLRGTISTPDGDDWGSTGTPDTTVVYDRPSSPAATGYALQDTASHATSTAVCEACHSQTQFHNYNETGADHETSIGSGDCIYCHKHNIGFRPFAKCLSCHTLPVGGRAAITAAFEGGSHHVQGVELTDAVCYQCHWEGDSVGNITSYHGGPAASGSVVDLVSNWTTTRPTVDTLGVTRIEYDVSLQTRAEFAKINTHCLGCHDDNSKTAQPFGDSKTPIQYAWDGESISARYSQAGTATWGKYQDADTADKNITKAYSAHSNAGNNSMGFDNRPATSGGTGVDGTIPNRSGSVNVLCFDCHNSHGSSVTGTATSYDSTHPLGKGGMIKDTTGGQGNYAVSYKPVDFDGSPTLVAHSAGAAICFDCHMTHSTDGVSLPWYYNSPFNATDRLISYWDKIGWEGAPGVNSGGPQLRYPFKDNLGTVGGHFLASSPLNTTPQKTIGGLCTPCHDPHGVSPTLAPNQAYGLPLLKGTWLTSPYKEDTAPTQINEARGGGDRQNPFNIGSPLPRSYNIDQTTFRAPTNATNHVFTRYNVGAAGAGDKITETSAVFGGLCLSCHPQSEIDPDTDNTWATSDRIHDAVAGWASTTGNNANNMMHNYSCSKCHAPHNSCLPRLALTDCLDDNHRDQVASGGSFTQYSSNSDEKGDGQGRGPAGGGGWGEEPIPSGWPNDGGGGYLFGTAGTSGQNKPPYPTCHDTQTTWPDQHWNNVTQW